jgi:hypothetical protein
MVPTEFPPIPLGCRQRLTTHYGTSVKGWLDEAPSLLATTAARWSLALHGYHDVGHASVIATATDRNGEHVLLKAWPDRHRYSREIQALQLWHRGADAIVRATDDERAVAALLTVGGVPGGANRPPHEVGLVAAALRVAHEAGHAADNPAGLPCLRDHVTDEVLPRINRRRRNTHLGTRTGRALRHIAGLREDPERTTMLHADLYLENIPFTRSGRPVLLDPLPMRGDAAYDWAFWTIYYRVGHGARRRLDQSRRTSGIPVEEIVPWCLLLSLDGLLYYEETDDPRLARMAAVLDALLEPAARFP